MNKIYGERQHEPIIKTRVNENHAEFIPRCKKQKFHQKMGRCLSIKSTCSEYGNLAGFNIL
jgi:hypothetical protein